MAESTLIINNENELAALAARLAPLLKTGDLVTLQGDLGAGKTAFARALINSLSSLPEEVPSPTFTLVQTYDLPQISLWHFDLYRLAEKEIDILELGWDDARREGVCLVEWPERLGRLLPHNRLEMKIDFHKENAGTRMVTFIPHGSWNGRLFVIPMERSDEGS